MTIFFISN